jgi:hypothetical protein
MWPKAPGTRFDPHMTLRSQNTLVNPHDLSDGFAARHAIHATVSDRRDHFTVGRAELGLAVMQTFFC